MSKYITKTIVLLLFTGVMLTLISACGKKAPPEPLSKVREKEN